MSLTNQLDESIYTMPFQLNIVSPMRIRQINVEYIATDALYIGKHNYLVQLILLDIAEFDVILGMNWLMNMMSI